MGEDNPHLKHIFPSKAKSEISSVQVLVHLLISLLVVKSK